MWKCQRRTGCQHQQNRNHYSVLGKTMLAGLIDRAGFRIRDVLDITFRVPAGPDMLGVYSTESVRRTRDGPCWPAISFPGGTLLMQSLSATHPTWVQASQAYSRGDLATAARLYRQLVTQEPQHIEALYRLGCIAYTQGDRHSRIYLGQAAALQPPLPPSIVPWAMWHGRLATSRLPQRSISRLC